MTENNDKGRRTSLVIPAFIDEVVSAYQKQSGAPTWNAALWEIVRAGVVLKFQEQEYLQSKIKDEEKNVVNDLPPQNQ